MGQDQGSYIDIIKLACKGMLPGNFTQTKIAKKLKISLSTFKRRLTKNATKLD